VSSLRPSLVCFGEQSVKPLPDDRSIAGELELDHFYTRIYRRDSDVSHYSIGTMLDGFLELSQDEIIGSVSLEKPDPKKAAIVLGMAAITYGAFLHLSDKITDTASAGRLAAALQPRLVKLPGLDSNQQPSG